MVLLNLTFIDPGGESGVAWVAYNPERPRREAVHMRIVRAFRIGMGGCFQVQGDSKDQVLQIKDFIDERIKKSGQGRQQAYEVRTIVGAEAFVPPSKHVRDSVLWAARVLYMLEFHVWNSYPEDELEWRTQRPNERMAVTDDNLRTWHLWKPGKRNDDAMAALKHLIVLGRKLERNGT